VAASPPECGSAAVTCTARESPATEERQGIAVSPVPDVRPKVPLAGSDEEGSKRSDSKAPLAPSDDEFGKGIDSAAEEKSKERLSTGAAVGFNEDESARSSVSGSKSEAIRVPLAVSGSVGAKV
jgi:hypothetical protein